MSIPSFLLVPKAKVTQNPAAFAQFLDQVLDEFSGYTIDRETGGSWRDGAGVTHDDVNLPVLVAVPDERAAMATFIELAAGLAHELGELCIFVSAGGETHFIWARPREGPPH